MSGNGCRINGMIIITGLRRMVLHGREVIVPIVFLAGVAGSAIKNFAVPLVASSANQRVVSPILGFEF